MSKGLFSGRVCAFTTMTFCEATGFHYSSVEKTTAALAACGVLPVVYVYGMEGGEKVGRPIWGEEDIDRVRDIADRLKENPRQRANRLQSENDTLRAELAALKGAAP